MEKLFFPCSFKSRCRYLLCMYIHRYDLIEDCHFIKLNEFGKWNSVFSEIILFKIMFLKRNTIKPLNSGLLCQLEFFHY